MFLLEERPCLVCKKLQKEGTKYCRPCAKIVAKRKSALYQQTTSKASHNAAALKYYRRTRKHYDTENLKVIRRLKVGL